MYRRTIIGVVGPPYPYCLLVAFCAFAWLRLCAFGACEIFWQKKNNEEFKTALINSFTLLLLGCVFVLLVLLVRVKSFRNKKKEFKTAHDNFKLLYSKISQAQSTNRLQRTKIKNELKKHLWGKKSLIRLVAFLCFCLGVFVLLVLLVRVKSFCKKNKEFKTALITSFTLLLIFNFLNCS